MLLGVGQFAVVMVFDIRGLKGLSLHDKFKQEASCREYVNLFGIVFSLSRSVGYFRSIALEGTNSVTHTVADRLGHLVCSISGIPEIYHFHIEFGIQEDVFGLDITVGNSPAMGEPECGYQLFEDVSCSSF